MNRLPAAVAIATIVAASAGCVASTDVRPECRTDETILILAAQAVPSATLIPCLDDLESGWAFSGSETDNGRFRFWLDSDRAGFRAVQVSLVDSCDTSGAVEVLPGPGEEGTRRFELPLALEPAFAADRLYTFDGGCVHVEYRFGPDAAPVLVLEADEAIGFRQREDLVRLAEENGLVLCGVDAPECAGGD